MMLKAAGGAALLAATLSISLAASPAYAASFSCAGVTAPDEAAICKNCDLAQLDVKMATLYGVITKLVGMGQRGMIQDDQRAWLTERNTCKADAACISAAYQTRIRAIEGMLSDIYSRGPF